MTSNGTGVVVVAGGGVEVHLDTAETTEDGRSDDRKRVCVGRGRGGSMEPGQPHSLGTRAQWVCDSHSIMDTVTNCVCVCVRACVCVFMDVC